MRRLGIITITAVFLLVTCPVLGDEGGTVRKKLRAVEETTEKANTEVGYIIGFTAFAPIIFVSALTWQLISAPVTAAKDTCDAVSAVYKKLKKEEKEEEQKELEQSPAGTDVNPEE